MLPCIWISMGQFGASLLQWCMVCWGESPSHWCMISCRGYTPIDVCILEMQFRREQQDACGQGFMHHEDRYMLVIKHLLKSNIKRNRLACLPIPQSKEGCTCAKCFRGYFSPRMQWRSAIGCRALCTPLLSPSLLPCGEGGRIRGGGGCRDG